MNYKKLLIASLSSTFVVSGFFSYAFGQSENINETILSYVGDITHEGTTMADLLLNQQETTSTRLGLINHYCDTLLHKRKDMWGEYEMALREINHNGFRYDPRQSLFMYVLCVWVDEKNNGRKVGSEDYKYRDYKSEFESITYKDDGGEVVPPNLTELLKEEWTSDFDFNDIRWLPDQSVLDADDNDGEQCDPGTTMQWCQFTEFAPRVFNTIMNDYGNLKLAGIYGYIYGESEEQIDKSIEAFSQAYFGIDPKIDKDNPCNDGSIIYLTDKKLEWDKEHCSHPRTHSMVKQTMLSAKRLTEDTVLLDGKKLLEEGDCTDRFNTTNNLIRCSLSNRGESFATSDMSTFQNLLLNEVMYYNLFLSYYGGEISANPKYNPLNLGSVSFSTDRNAKEIGQITREQFLAQEAMDQMNRLLAHIYTTYPVHVWLMAYLEDLLAYRATLIKLWTPTNQLYYTRRNAQSCQAP